jgi:NADP-dependent 3-hydroxy acid dehydrogenase YdfG
MDAMQQRGSVLVTGGGNGISGADALHLVGRGKDLFAGVGEIDTGRAVAGRYPRIAAVEPDITAEAHVAKLDEVLPERHTVVSDGGIAAGGPIQAVSLDDIRRLAEVDIVGQVAGVAAQDAP